MMLSMVRANRFCAPTEAASRKMARHGRRRIKLVAAAEQEHCDLGKQVRKRSNGPVSRQKDAALHSPAFARGQGFEVVNREEVDVRRVVPLVREQLSLRGAPG